MMVNWIGISFSRGQVSGAMLVFGSVFSLHIQLAFLKWFVCCLFFGGFGMNISPFWGAVWMWCLHPRKLTAYRGPQNDALEMVTPASNMVIFNIYVKFLGCIGDIMNILEALCYEHALVCQVPPGRVWVASQIVWHFVVVFSVWLPSLKLT